MSKLFLVATPIGNLQDITLRALETLKEVDLIICEDTRRTLKLLNHFEIKKPLVSFHRHSTPEKIDFLIRKILANEKTALVSDSGTPGIADPGNLLLAHIYRQKSPITIIPIPGVSSLTAMASVSGINTDQFTFLGFLPHKKRKQSILQKIAESEIPTIFFESPHRLEKTLESFTTFLKEDQQLVVGCELTKMFEKIYVGNINEINLQIKSKPIKGEFVIIVDGRHN